MRGQKGFSGAGLFRPCGGRPRGPALKNVPTPRSELTTMGRENDVSMLCRNGVTKAPRSPEKGLPWIQGGPAALGLGKSSWKAPSQKNRLGRTMTILGTQSENVAWAVGPILLASPKRGWGRPLKRGRPNGFFKKNLERSAGARQHLLRLPTGRVPRRTNSGTSKKTSGRPYVCTGCRGPPSRRGLLKGGRRQRIEAGKMVIAQRFLFLKRFEAPRVCFPEGVWTAKKKEG